MSPGQDRGWRACRRGEGHTDGPSATKARRPSGQAARDAWRPDRSLLSALAVLATRIRLLADRKVGPGSGLASAT